jgi:protoheme IX farnesyltransferase
VSNLPDASDPVATDPEAVNVDDFHGPVGPMHDQGRYETPVAGTDDQASAPSRGETLRRYVMVTKPRIIELLLITTVPAMVVAAQGWPGTWLVLATLIGGTLSAASANTINNWCDRDVDALMARTSKRPTAMGQLPPDRVLQFGIVLGILGFTWLALLVNVTAAALATSAIFFYVFVYTVGLKRRTPQAVVIGGAAGCVPVLTGWAAVPGASLADPAPWALFAIVFWWTPPHFWALAMKYRDDYAAAGLPMLTVTHGNAEATRHILLYSWLLLSVVLLAIVALQAGIIFAVAAIALTIGWLVFAYRLRAEQSVKSAMRLFHYSTSYLTLIFIAAALDALA